MDRRYRNWLENNFVLEIGNEPNYLKELYYDTISKRDKFILDECKEDLAMAELLANDVVFMNNINIKTVGEEYTACIYVICSDFFHLACADAECIVYNDFEEPSEILDLYRFFIKDTMWGSYKWVAKKRNLQPHPHIKKRMIQEGVWEDWMEDLTPRTKEEVRENQIKKVLN